MTTRLFFLMLCAWPGFLLAQVVSRDMADPESCPWRQGDWVSARGGMAASAERAPDAPAGGKTLRVEVTYPARTFAFWDALPLDGTVPGNVQRVSGWIRSSGAINALVVRFADAKGRMEVEIGGKKRKLELGVNHQKAGEWVAFDAPVPADWPRPLTFGGIAANNWGNRNEAEPRTSVVELCDLRVFTDVSAVPEEERPVSAVVQFPVPGNIFYADESKPEAHLVVGSWLGRTLALEATARVVSADGSERPVAVAPFACGEFAARTIALPFAQPGAYTVHVDVKGLPKPLSFRHRYVVVLRPPELTAAQKRASPYGLNIHSGGAVDYTRIARLGFVWVRDYAFNLEWMKRARGVGDYAGWPWYPKILEGISNAGLELLPCLMGALKADPEAEEPTDGWRRDLAGVFVGFPAMRCWELDNEFHLGGKDYAGTLAGYRYGRRHQVFAEISKAIAPGNWVVEQGAAGIAVEAARTHIAAGRYGGIDVLNGHHYCGVTPPEIAKSNANTGQADAVNALFRDTLVEWDRVARLDGKDRQTWITEWGWDTKAGQPVSEWEQAAYLQRGYMLGFACGVDKLFWYWYDDSPGAEVFFDGCGIFDHKPKLEPKPVAAAFAAIRSFLPADMEYVGYARLSPNALAQVFRVGGKLVAAAFLVDPEKPDEGLTVEPPKNAAAYDMFGAPVPAGPRALNLAPTWFVDVDPACDWVRQTALDVTSRHYVRCVSGEAFGIDVAAGGVYSVETPAGWTVERADGRFRVAVPEGTPRGAAVVRVNGRADGAGKEVPVDVDVIPEVFLKGDAVGFDGRFALRVLNQSAARKRHTIRADVPEGWRVEPAEASTELDAGEATTLSFALAQARPLGADAGASAPRLIARNEKGMALAHVPVVPREWRLQPVSGLTLDGDLSDWPQEARIPAWMLGPRGEEEPADIRFGYAAEGLYVAVALRDSKGFVADPKAFWRAADCLELMFGPVANFVEGASWAKTDRQFWLCPLIGQNRVYVGNWSRHADVKAESDISVRSAAKRWEDGYAMEALIPAAQLGDWAPKAGDTMAMSFTVAVQGRRGNREVFWPASKLDDVVAKPWMWGRVTLD